MKHVIKIAKRYDINKIRSSLEDVLKICDWHTNHNQIGLTHSLGLSAKEAWYDATGSLTYVWGDNAFDENGNLRKHTVVRTEDQFSYFVDEFKDTYFYDIYQDLSKIYRFGRVRLMRSRPKTCLSWHVDSEQRLHIPIITNLGAHLVIEDAANHLTADGSVYLADTTKYHTAFNAGLEPRIHFVACVIG